MKKITVGFFLFLTLFLMACQNETEVTTEMTSTRITHNAPAYSEGVLYSADLWTDSSSYDDPARDLTDQNIQAVWIRSDYKDQESYAFSYLGIPEDGDGRAVLLLHGGGGTSYREWVTSWMQKGYIALAIDLEGHIPNPEGTVNDYPQNLYTNSPYPTPKNTNYGDQSLPIEETWMHYATRTTILAHTFLQGLAQVDPLKVGVVGISWGGVIASIVAGYDDRFAFVVPIYCSVNQANTGTSISTYLEQNPEALIWDSDQALRQVTTPIHFVVSNIDRHCRLDSIQKTLDHLQNGSVTVLKDWLHSHAIAIEAMEPYTVADRILNQQDRIQFSPGDDGSWEITVPEDLAISSLVIVYTTDPLTIDSSWSKRRITQTTNPVTFDVPESTTYYYLSVEDSQGNIWSTKLLTTSE